VVSARAPHATDPLGALRESRSAVSHLLVWLMTGTSADAVDAALVRFDGHGLDTRHTMVAYKETPLEPAMRREILDVASAASLPLERLMRLDAALGERYAAAVFELLAEAGVDRADVQAIG